MGFSAGFIGEILKLPWPLFPKYKNIYPTGIRIEIPNQVTTITYNVSLPANNHYELQSIVYSASGYTDQDNYHLIKNDEYILRQIYTKELGQVKQIRPIVKIDSSDTLTFIFNNVSGTAKTIWLDLDFTCNSPIKV